MRLTQKVSFFCVYIDYTGWMIGIEEDSVRSSHSGSPSVSCVLFNHLSPSS